MLRRFCLPILVLLFSIATAAAAPITIDVGGVQRTYLIAGQLNNGPKPLIIVLHGLGGNGADAAAATHLGQIAAKAGFVAVFPDGLAQQWNHYPAGSPVTPTAVQRYQKNGINTPPDDMAFINAIIDRLVGNGRADAKHVYIVGFSAGGFMSLKLLCEEANRFAAAALISTGMPTDNGASCHPAHPVPVLMEHGTADDHVPYNGGLVLDRSFTVWPADKLTHWFTTLDGCTGAPAVSTVTPSHLPTQLSNWQCKSGIVDFYKVTNGPHTVYQFPPPAPTIWRFLQAYSL